MNMKLNAIQNTKDFRLHGKMYLSIGHSWRKTFKKQLLLQLQWQWQLQLRLRVQLQQGPPSLKGGHKKDVPTRITDKGTNCSIAHVEDEDRTAGSVQLTAKEWAQKPSLSLSFDKEFPSLHM